MSWLIVQNESVCPKPSSEKTRNPQGFTLVSSNPEYRTQEEKGMKNNEKQQTKLQRKNHKNNEMTHQAYFPSYRHSKSRNRIILKNNSQRGRRLWNCCRTHEATADDLLYCAFKQLISSVLPAEKWRTDSETPFFLIFMLNSKVIWGAATEKYILNREMIIAVKATHRPHIRLQKLHTHTHTYCSIWRTKTKTRMNTFSTLRKIVSFT